MIQVLPFNPDLFSPALLKERGRQGFSRVTSEWLRHEVLMCSLGWAFMAVDNDGFPLGAAGAGLVYPGVAHVWAVFLKMRPHDMALCLRRLKQGLPEFCAMHHIRRVQAYVDPKVTGAETLVRYLGMKCEGALSGFGIDGEEWGMYAKVMTNGSNDST